MLQYTFRMASVLGIWDTEFTSLNARYRYGKGEVTGATEDNFDLFGSGDGGGGGGDGDITPDASRPLGLEGSRVGSRATASQTDIVNERKSSETRCVSAVQLFPQTLALFPFPKIQLINRFPRKFVH